MWRHLKASGKHLGDLWEASGETWEAPGGSPGPPWLQRRPGLKLCQTHRVLLSKVARATILAESGEGDMHDLRSLRTKVGGRRPGTAATEASPALKTIRQNPYSVNTVWGKNKSFSSAQLPLRGNPI